MKNFEGERGVKMFSEHEDSECEYKAVKMFHQFQS